MTCDDCRWKVEKEICPNGFLYEENAVDFAEYCPDFIRTDLTKEKKKKMNEFFSLADKLRKTGPIEITVRSNEYQDWTVDVTQDRLFILSVQDADADKCFTEAYARLKGWADSTKEEN